MSPRGGLAIIEGGPRFHKKTRVRGRGAFIGNGCVWQKFRARVRAFFLDEPGAGSWQLSKADLNS